MLFRSRCLDAGDDGRLRSGGAESSEDFIVILTSFRVLSAICTVLLKFENTKRDICTWAMLKWLGMLGHSSCFPIGPDLPYSKKKIDFRFSLEFSPRPPQFLFIVIFTIGLSIGTAALAQSIRVQNSILDYIYSTIYIYIIQYENF